MDKTLLNQRITELCKNKKVSMHAAFIESGVGKNFKTNLKTHDPSYKNLQLLAKYFDVPVDYLIGDINENDLKTKEIDRFLYLLTSLGYIVNIEDDSKYILQKGNLTVELTKEELLSEIQKIKDYKNNPWSLAVNKWEQEHLTHNITNSINQSPNSVLTIHNSYNITPQELELVELYKTFSLQQQKALLDYAFNLKE